MATDPVIVSGDACSDMQRRRFIQVSAGLATTATIGVKPVLARGQGVVAEEDHAMG